MRMLSGLLHICAKTKALAPVSAMPTHMLRICANYLQGGKAKTIASAKKTEYTLCPLSAQTSQFQHPNLNREVRRSPTWHSSKSESALKRFEPVAITML